MALSFALAVYQDVPGQGIPLALLSSCLELTTSSDLPSIRALAYVILRIWA